MNEAVTSVKVYVGVRINQFIRINMKQILAAAFLSLITFAPAWASPLYAGIQIGDDSAVALLGYQVNKKYAVEAHYLKSDSLISHAGVTVDTSIIGVGLIGIVRFPMKWKEVQPYDLFVKAGFQRSTTKETYSIPSSVTLTLPYNDVINSHQNQSIFGVGAELDFTKNVSGRMGIDFLGSNKSINLCALYKF